MLQKTVKLQILWDPEIQAFKFSYTDLNTFLDLEISWGHNLMR